MGIESKRAPIFERHTALGCGKCGKLKLDFCKFPPGRKIFVKFWGKKHCNGVKLAIWFYL